MARARKEERRMRVVSELPESLWERVRFAAIRERRPVSDVIRGLLVEWVETKEKRGKGKR